MQANQKTVYVGSFNVRAFGGRTWVHVVHDVEKGYLAINDLGCWWVSFWTMSAYRAQHQDYLHEINGKTERYEVDPESASRVNQILTACERVDGRINRFVRQA